MEGKTLTKKEIDELVGNQKTLFRQLSEVENNDNKSKKEIILKIRDVTRPLVEAGYYPNIKLEDLASFIFSKLEEYGISYHKSGHYYDLFEDDEKRTHGTNSVSSEGRNHVHEFIKDEENPAIEKCACNAFKLYGIMYSGVPLELEEQEAKSQETQSDSTSEDSNIKTPEKKILNPHDHKPTELFYRAKSNAERLADILEDLMKKFGDRPDIAGLILDFYKENKLDIDAEIEEQKDIEAQLLAIDKMTDFRQRIGAFEKIKAKLLIMTTYHIHKVAKMLNCSAKHLKNDVLNKKVEDDIKYFRKWPFKCSCGKTTEVDVADEMNQMIIKAKNGEEVEMVKFN